MRNKSIFLLWAMALAICAGACSSGDESRKKDPLEGVDPAILRNQPGLMVQPVDINRDNRPDIFNYYQQVQRRGQPPTNALVLKEMDLDFNGTIDMWRVWRWSGELAREWADTNGDGRYDVVTYFENGRPVKKTLDINYDGRPDRWQEFDESGNIKLFARDTNFSGKPDVFEQYQQGRLVRTGWDTNDDGEADIWRP